MKPETSGSHASPDQAIRLLQVVPFFAGVSQTNLLPLAAACRLRRYRATQVIFHRGDPGDTLHIVISGAIRILLSAPDGDEILLAHLQQGEFFGELSLLDGLPRSATAVAIDDTVTLALERPEFLQVLERTPALARQVILAMCARLRRTDVLLGDSAFLDVAARLARRLLDLAQGRGLPQPAGGSAEVRITQTELATMVGASRETVNKELRVLEGRGLLRVQRGKIAIPNPAALRAVEW
jgi:CRP-like cAMP-binding protein